MNKNSHGKPYDELLKKYLDALQDIQYLEYKVRTLNEEIDAWQKAYEDHVEILEEYGLI